jgi:protein-S-isoprenylcysteine O-methyltransferase Ste14
MRPSTILFLLGSRGVPTFLFGGMAALTGVAALRSHGAADAAFHALSGGLWLMFAVLVNVRPTPLRRGTSVSGAAAALGAQAALVTLGIAAGSSGAGVRVALGDALLVGGLAFALASVAVLGRCFGVLPDVRGLVTRGPYRLVRHPLYLGELVAALGIAAGSRRWTIALGAWAACLVLQVVRTHYEETTLRAEFPEYSTYAQGTKRLIPGIV